MEVRKDGSRLLRSSRGPGMIFLKEEGKHLRIVTVGVLFLDDDDASDLQQAISYWRSNGRLPGMEHLEQSFKDMGEDD